MHKSWPSIGFRDLDFKNTVGGMPRLNDNIHRTVFFLYGRNPKSGEIEGPLGTGTMFGVQGGQYGLYIRHIYAVTCWHVAVKLGASILRIHTQDGKSRFIELDPSEWQFIPNGDDLCAAYMTDHLDNQTDEISCLPASLLATDDFIEKDKIGVGEDGFMLGLFADHPGKIRNLIAARFGNISLLASDDEPLLQPHGIKRPSHIFDMRSRGGFSGSPVFIYRTPAGDLRTATERGRDKMIRSGTTRYAMNPFSPGTEEIRHFSDDIDRHDNTFLMVLGIHAGHYPERVEAIKASVSPASDDLIREGDRLKIPGSMSVVVPATEIFNLINNNKFRSDRAKLDREEEAARAQRKATEPDAAEVSRPVATDDGSTHREDFNSLLDAAARKPKQDGQT